MDKFAATPSKGFLRSLVVFVAVGVAVRSRAADDSNKVYTLNGQNLQWPCSSTKNIYTSTGQYIAKNIIATRVQIWKNRAFVLTPRFKSGVPFTVSEVNLNCSNTCWPKLIPYPYWSLHEEGEAKSIQNAVDIFLDPLGILWVLDTGLINNMEQVVRTRQPKIVAIDVKTNKVVKWIDLSGLVCPASRLNYITVDYGEDGKAFVYVSDAATRAVIVWDVTTDRGYRVVLPKAITQDGGKRDVLYIALSHKSSGNVLYLTYLSSNRMYAIKTCNLRMGCAEGTVTDLGPKPNKMVILGTDGKSNLYFRYRGQGDVYVWDTDTDFGNFSLLQKTADCRLATHVLPGPDITWVVESNFPDYISNSVGCFGANVRLHPLEKLIGS
ncbi:protein yellow-like [Daktulosphaira vitifoliae]|uniref:protein yellow-like n=1 Tax=Daktulosphaira vitifoliae TaxID=58002 RepID=UPI0021AAD735|nr:protein yellow-like [Daktulosphaira vitifoliae]